MPLTEKVPAEPVIAPVVALVPSPQLIEAQNAPAVRVGTEATVQARAEMRLRPCARLFQDQLVPGNGERDFHQLAVAGAVIKRVPGRRPDGIRAARRRDLPLAIVEIRVPTDVRLCSCCSSL